MKKTLKNMKFIGLAMILSWTQIAFTNPNSEPPLKLGKNLTKLLDQKNAKSQFEVLIFLNERPDLSAAKNLKTKIEKNVFVVNALKETAIKSQKPILSILESKNIKHKRFYVANLIVAYNISKEQIKELAQRADVNRILADPKVKGLVSKFDDEQRNADEQAKGTERGISHVKADKVWDELAIKGEGIVIAGQDTGIDFEHPAISKQYRGYDDINGVVNHDYSWYDAIQEPVTEGDTNSKCDYASAEPCDDNGHGTHTVGTMVGDDGAQNQIGVAPGAKWIGCRNMDDGNGRPSTYISCFQFFLAPFPVNGDSFVDGDATKAPHIINNSWGCPEDEGCEGNEFVEILENLKAAGIFTIASAGNEGSSCSTIADGPAHNSSTTFSVGALSSPNSRVAFFSSRGPSAFDGEIGPDISAPGVFVRSAVPGGGYSSFSGTSMAGPHVAGVAALLWSADNNLIGEIDASADVLTGSAKGLTASQTCGGVNGREIPNNVYGYGLINAYDAIRSRI